MSDRTGLLAAVASAAGMGTDAEGDVTVTAALIAQHFPDIAAGFRAEGADNEHRRLMGIEQAMLPGHKAIIEAHKADRSKTPADAAHAVIAAENTARGRHAAALEQDEKQVKGLRSEPANGLVQPETPAGHGLSGEAKWKAEFNASAPLQDEFKTEARYVAFKTAAAAGRVRILNNKSQEN